jgi:hypothetical protein
MCRRTALTLTAMALLCSTVSYNTAAPGLSVDRHGWDNRNED